MVKGFKYFVLGVFILALAFPAINGVKPLVDQGKELAGHFEVPDTPTFTWNNWFSGGYQDSLEKHLQYHTGFRPFFVRLRNQLDYSLFGKINAVDSYEGLNGHFFRPSEDHGIAGRDFVGVEVAKEKAEKLKFIQDRLDSLGTHLVICIAPGKAWYHKESIPPERLEQKGKHQNYDFYRGQFQQRGIRYIDLNEWFLQLKDTTSMPLYSKGGVHWTLYGSFVGTDSLLRYMEATANIDLPGLAVETIVKADKPWFPETDIFNALNVLERIDEMQMYHPKPAFEDSIGRIRPDVLLIGDSYWHFPLWHKIPEYVWSDRSSYWYYFQEKQLNSLGPKTPTGQLNLADEYRDMDFVVLFFTPTNFNRFCYGFIDQTYDLLQENPTLEVR